MAFSADHPRIVALEYAVQALARLLPPAAAEAFDQAMRQAGDDFVVEAGDDFVVEAGDDFVVVAGAGPIGLLAIDISAALNRIADAARER
jgi:hypothetical protein